MSGLAPLLGWPERIAPSPPGSAGLGLALLTIALLTWQQVRATWLERRAPGPILRRAPAEESERGRLYWAVTSILVILLAVVVIERLRVMA